MMRLAARVAAGAGAVLLAVVALSTRGSGPATLLESVHGLAYPMNAEALGDSGLVTAKAQMGMYANAESFASALALVWHNCRAYNAESSPIHSDAGLLAALSARLVDKWVLSPDRPSDPTTLEWNEPELQPL